MKQVSAPATLSEAYLLKGALDAQGIPATIRGEELTADVGAASPVAELGPSLWVGDADVPRARKVIDRLADGTHVVQTGEADVDTDTAFAVGEGEDARAADEAAHRAMSDLFVTAGGLARAPGRGDLVDDATHLHAVLLDSRAPYGIDAATWDELRRLSGVLADAAAADEDAARDAATALRDFLRGFV